MKDKRKWRDFSAICACMIVFFLFGCSTSDGSADTESDKTQRVASEQRTATMALVGQTLSDFTVVDHKGQKVTSSDFKGKPMFIVDWASWCPDCQAYLPEVQALYEEFGDDVHFVMLNLTDGTRETEEQARAYIKEENYSFPVYFDYGEKAASTLKVVYIPTTYIVDKDQKILQVYEHGLEAKELKKVIKKAL